jgi:hypothetical protein
MNKIKIIVLLLLGVGAIESRAAEFTVLKPNLMKCLMEASLHCSSLPSDNIYVAAAMSSHEEYKNTQSGDCRKALLALSGNFDCAQSCTADKGAEWAKHHTNKWSLTRYLSGWKAHPFTEDPKPALAGIYIQCAQRCISDCVEHKS